MQHGRETNRPRIALIHAVAVAMAPIRDAFAALWPAAETVNLLDDALSIDRAREGVLSPAVSARIGHLADYAMAADAAAILYTCSAFGPAIEAAAARLPVPVLKPNEAMFEEAFGAGLRLGMIATFRPSIASMEAEFAATAGAKGSAATLKTVLADGAMEALQAGDAATHNQMVADAARNLAGVDAIMLAQFSTSCARDAAAAVADAPVITSPDAAVRALRERLRARHASMEA